MKNVIRYTVATVTTIGFIFVWFTMWSNAIAKGAPVVNEPVFFWYAVILSIATTILPFCLAIVADEEEIQPKI